MKAFPQAIKEDIFEQGMDLRDYFAAKAMQSIVGNDPAEMIDSGYVAEKAYRYADAMMETRNHEAY